MYIKSKQDEIQSYLSDASNMSGFADSVVFPECEEEVVEVLAKASRQGTPVTVSGAGTGIVGGRVPGGGVVLATDRLNSFKGIFGNDSGCYAIAQAGIRLSDFQKLVTAAGLIYPPDPTETNCFLGGTVATNASGARSFKYGPTRRYVRRLRIVLASGDLLELKRGDINTDDGYFRLSLSGDQMIESRIPSYQMPRTRKHTSGYYVSPKMDVLDLFIGSEGTLGVITEVETDLLSKPEGIISGIVFFDSEQSLLEFVREARERSFQSRTSNSATTEVDARALEYFDRESLQFLAKEYHSIPSESVGAIFFEQETTSKSEDLLMEQWLLLLTRHNALVDKSWFAVSESDQEKLREFRHRLPVLVNEWLARHGQRKVSTDMAVPDEVFPEMLSFYRETLHESKLHFVVFGHIGDSHVHVNILPRNDSEAAKARDLYLQFVRRAVALGGTISAEHGVGKLKREYLKLLYSEQHLREMADLKHAFDPSGILGRGNIFSESLLIR